MIKKVILLFIEVINRFICKVKVRNTYETLKAILDFKMSVSRFGDGEFDLIFGKDLPFQTYSDKISDSLISVLQNRESNENCLIGIPSTYSSLKGFNIKSKVFWFKYFAYNRKTINKILSNSVPYYDAQISRIYINRRDKHKTKEYFDLWKQIWENKNILIVEGKLSRFGMGNTLLDSAKSIRRIVCPSENAFDYIDEICDCVKRVNGVDLVLVSLGPTATVLAYELSKDGIWTIDTGNMDMEYEWMNRHAKTQEAIGNKYTHEAKGGTLVDSFVDEKYATQIIKIIG